MSQHSFLFHDYETFGINPALDWPAQFAAIRTDLELNEIEQPINIFCKQPLDHLPHPMACLVTGLTPQEVNEKGMVEPEFAKQIHQAMMQAGTCALGYNSLRFDDEVTRHIFYRNFYDPYAREWQNQNSRWDLIDMVRLIAALRPDGIEWPRNEDGNISFKLEALTRENGITHQSAHDAISDVRATIALARLIKQKKTRVFNYYFNNRSKQAVSAILNLINKPMLVHVSGMYGAKRQNLSVIVPLMQHPSKSNEVVVYDLTVDPSPLLQLPANEVQRLVFTASQQLAEGEQRIPLRTIHINKCPAIMPIGVLLAENQERLGINLSLCQQHRDALLANPMLPQKITEVFSSTTYTEATDPDQMLYSGFFGTEDKRQMSRIIHATPDQLLQLGVAFKDKRLDEMLFRYRGRHYFETMDSEEQKQWLHHCRERLLDDKPSNKILTVSQFKQALDTAIKAHHNSYQQGLLKKLQHYGDSVTDYLNSG